MTDFEASTPTLGAQQAEKVTDGSDIIAVDASSTAQAAAAVTAELQEQATGAAAENPATSSTEAEPRPSPFDDPGKSIAAAEGIAAPAQEAEADTTAPAQGAAAAAAAASAIASDASDAAPEPDARKPDAAAESTVAASSVSAQPVPADEVVGAPDGLQQCQQAVEEAESVTVPGSVAAAKAAFLTQKSAEKVLSPQSSSSHAHSNGVAANASAAALEYEDEKPVIKVRELREQLSATNIPLTGGSRRQSSDGKEEEKRGPSPVLSEHDKVNTANVAELLKTAEYKLVPGVDVVPYDELIKLRLEDGIDVTRKEDYLSATDFSNILGMDKEAFGKLPKWKKLQVKKTKLLF